MTNSLPDLGNHSAEELLDKMYFLQKHCFFKDSIIEPLMEEYQLSEESMVNLLKYCIQQKWLTTSNFMPAYYLRPDKVKLFPINLSSRGLAYINKAASCSPDESGQP